MITLRKAEPNDSTFVYGLRTNLSDEENYKSGCQITYQEHKHFWDKNFRYYKIILHKGRRVGYCGLVNKDFRIAIIPECRGKGIGKSVVKQCSDLIKDNKIYVMKTNKASLKCFLGNNYKIIDEKGEYYEIQKAW